MRWSGVAHLLCEIFKRLRPVGLLEGNSYAFPIIQMDLADATGPSVVRVDRTIRSCAPATSLCCAKDARHQRLEAPKNLAQFSPSYVHACGVGGRVPPRNPSWLWGISLGSVEVMHSTHSTQHSCDNGGFNSHEN